MELAETLLRSKYVFAGRLLRVRVDTVRLADGQTATREVVDHPGAVAMVPITASGHVLLVRQWRQPVGRVLLEIPAGTLAPGEPPEQTARRELQEEVGMEPGKLEKLAAVALAPGYSSEVIHLYLATDLRPSRMQADADERLETAEIPLAQAIQDALTGKFEDAKTALAILLAAARLGRIGTAPTAAPSITS